MTNRRKILIVDDEQELCLLIKAYLSKKNFEVHDSFSLSDGLKKMKKIQPDILFLDNNLTDGTGWTNVHKFYEINPDLKIFLMSGFTPALPIIKDKEFKVLTKPISFNDLESIVQHVSA